MSTFQLSEAQTATLQRLFNTADGEYFSNPGTTGIYTKLYEKLIEFITDGDNFVSGVDEASGNWIVGAKGINANTDANAVFIREYTLLQYKMRNGQDHPDADIAQKASNGVARNFFIDLLHYKEVPNNPDTYYFAPGPYTIPTIEEIGLTDAGAAASTVFNDTYAPWAGTLLFSYLGYDDFFKDWLLTNEPVSGPDTNGELRTFVTESGTYDLIAAISAGYQASIATGISYTIHSGINAILIANDLAPLGSNDGKQQDLIDLTDAYFKNSYGLTDSELEIFEPGDSLIFNAPFSVFGGSRYIIGSINNDTSEDFETSNYYPDIQDGSDVVNMGRGDDVINATSGYDLIDGGEGDDTVDYSTLFTLFGIGSIGIKLEEVTGEDALYDSRVVVERWLPTFFTDLLYSVETIIGTDAVDSLIVDYLPEDLKLKIQNLGGTANDTITDIIDASALSGGVEINTDASGNGYIKKKSGPGGTIELENALAQNTGAQPKARVKLTNEDDIITGSLGTIEVHAGGGDDEIKTKGINNIIYAGLGDDSIDRVGQGSQVFTGQGEDKVVISNNILIADAENNDRTFIGKKELTGGLRGAESESPWAHHPLGFKYSMNDEGQLVISTKGLNDFEAFVANYNDRLIDNNPTANITLVEVNVEAGRLVETPTPDGYIEENFRVLDFAWKAWFGEERKPGVDPLVLDLDGDGIELRPQVLKTPSFDLDGDGYSEPTGWVMPDDGFLAIDLNANGLIDGIHELFGSATEDGFTALQAYDSNSDGVIDASDTVFVDLRIWQDNDTDAVTDAGELKTLADFDITSINLTSSAPLAGEGVIDGNRIAAVGSYTKADGSTNTIVDAVLTVDNFETTYMGDLSISSEAALLPELKGHGVLPDLRVAMSRDVNFRQLVETEINNLTSLDLDVLRDAAMTIFTGWAQSDAAASVNSVNDKDIPILSTVDSEGRTQINDFGIYDAVLGHWVLASGKDIVDTNGDVILAPTAADILALDPSDLNITNPQNYSWGELSSAELNFYEHYIGEALALGSTPVAGASLADLREAAISVIESIEQTLDIMSVRLAVQGPLNGFFPEIAYDVEKDVFYATTDRQLAPSFEAILSVAQSEADPITYLASWERALKLVMTNFDRGEDYLKVSHNFVFANIVAAHEAINSNLNIIDASEALGIPRDYIVSGSGELVGTDDHDIIYLNGGDQIAKGGAGYDVYVVGKNFGNDIIEDIETFGKSHEPDLIRFADIKSTEVSASRDGEDLIITVDATGDSLRVIRQFEGEKPGLFGGFVDEGTGVAEITFVDGIVWDQYDIAKAASVRNDASFDLTGTDSVDYLDGGSGNDRLEGAGDGDVYYFGIGYGEDVIFDEMTNVLVNGDDYLLFGDELEFSDVTFTRIGNSDDLEISINGTADKLTIENQFWTSHTGPFGIQNFNQIELLWFGTNYYTNEEIIQEVLNQAQTDGDDTIYGFYRQDVLDGGLGNDFLSGGDDSDTYYFGKGYGQDVIEENQEIILTVSDDTVIFNEDVAVSDVVFSRDGTSDDLLVSFTDDNATLTIINQFDLAYTGLGNYWFDRIETFQFQDAASTTISWDELFVDLIEQDQTTGDDIIYGFDREDVLDGGVGDDFLSGGNENDTYIFGLGYGHDTIDDDLGNVLSGEFDIVNFTSGLEVADATLSRDNNDLTISFVGGDQVTLLNQFSYGGLGSGSYDEIEEYHFSDGTIWSAAVVRELLLQGTNGDDVIIGYGFNDTLDGGTGNDRLEGLDGSDLYKFDIGYGQDIIYDHHSIVSYGNLDAIEFGSSITISNIELTRDADDLVFSIQGVTDSLTIEDNFEGSFGYYEIEEYHFSDGTIWTIDDVKQQLISQSITSGNDILTGFGGDDFLNSGSGNDTISGLSGDDLITGGLGNDVLEGGNGSDTYVYNLGDGNDLITDTQSASYETDKLVLHGINTSDVSLSVSTQDENDLILTLSDNSTIELNEFFWGYGQSIEEIIFDDGTVWTKADVEAALLTEEPEDDAIHGTDGNDTLSGTSDNDAFDGGLGDDTVSGKQGDDSYRYYSGDGDDTIKELYYHSGNDSLVFKDLNESDVTISRSWSDAEDILITDNVTGHSITLDEQLYNTKSGVEEIVYADGTVQSADSTTLRELAHYRGTSAGDTINGGSYRDVFDGGLGDDTLSGKQGGDSYLYASGDGNDTIKELNYHSGSDSLVFKDLNASNVTISRSWTDAEDILITDNSTGESITLDEQLYNASSGVEEIVYADGTVQSADTTSLRELAHYQGTTTGDAINGSSYRDVFDGGLGGDTLSGKQGDDSYLYASGDGSDTINELYYHSGNDQLVFKDLNASDITLSVSTSDSNDLWITVNSTGDQITVDRQFYNTKAGVEEIVFADGSVLYDENFIV